MHFTLKTNPLKRSDLDELVEDTTVAAHASGAELESACDVEAEELVPEETGGGSPRHLSALVFALLGIVIFVGTFVVVDKMTPYHLWKEIVEDKNVALAILLGVKVLSEGSRQVEWASAISLA